MNRKALCFLFTIHHSALRIAFVRVCTETYWHAGRVNSALHTPPLFAFNSLPARKVYPAALACGGTLLAVR